MSRHRVGAWWIAAGVAAFLAGGRLVAQEKAVEGKAEVAGGPATSLQSALAKLIPQGQSSLNVTIPILAGGILKDLVIAASITREDDENLDMVALVIEMYDGRGEIDMTINMETARFHLPSGILESDRPTQISNAQFDLTGDEGLIYDTNKQQGKLPGKVTMIVYTREEEAEAEEREEKDE